MHIEPLTCPACGYNLTGLPVNRCPECGGAFDPAELVARQGVRPAGRTVLRRHVEFVFLSMLLCSVSTCMIREFAYADSAERIVHELPAPASYLFWTTWLPVGILSTVFVGIALSLSRTLRRSAVSRYRGLCMVLFLGLLSAMLMFELSCAEAIATLGD